MEEFSKDFHTLNYVILNSERTLLFAHNHPDGDSVGAVLALKEYIVSSGKEAVLTCFDPMPAFIAPLAGDSFVFPDRIDMKNFPLIIAADSVERGFSSILPRLSENQIITLIDHHPDIILRRDINILDPKASSTCELVYYFFEANNIPITRNMATYLMLGILSDTGSFQHANTTSKVFEISAKLMKLGAPVPKIAAAALTSKNINSLRLWGRAFEKAKINPKNGMIISVLTQEDLRECHAGTEDIEPVAGILNTVPGTKFSLILSERDGGVVKGSLRSEEYKGVDVSRIAATLGGGGHKLASGFEVKGKIVETPDGWEII